MFGAVNRARISQMIRKRISLRRPLRMFTSREERVTLDDRGQTTVRKKVRTRASGLRLLEALRPPL
jgi:hypothetical protein